EGLSQFAVNASTTNLFYDDSVRCPQCFQPRLVDCSNDADGQAWTREGMAPYPFFRQAKCHAYLANLVFEEHAQRLNQFERHLCGQPSNVMVCLDARCGRCCIMAGALDDVGVECSLGQEGDRPTLFFQSQGFFFEDP